jgi:phage host-nuclease inhibitor protein Gam
MPRGKEIEAVEENLKEMERLAHDYNIAHSRLTSRISQYNAAIEAARKKYLPSLRVNVSVLEDVRRKLIGAVEEHPELFARKKSMVLHDVRFGYRKEKGKVSWRHKEKVLELIKRLFPSRAGDLIRTKEDPNKDALAKMPAADLKRLGVTVTDDGDAPFVICSDTEAEKAVKDLLKALNGGKEGP